MYIFPYPILTLVLFFLAALCFSIIINFLLLKFVKTLGIRNHSETLIRWSSTSKPALGGISFFIVFLISFTCFSFIHAGQPENFDLQNLGLLLAVSLGFLLGLFDDAYNTRPWLKLFTQIFCGVILIVAGIQIDFFQNDMANQALTIFWVVGIMNSINMLDNMDGITSIVSMGILLGMLGMVIFQQDIHNPVMIILLGTIAALAGFLFFNWNPSQMYMGDTGSQFLGVLLAALGILFLWNGQYIHGEKNQFMQLIMVGIAFGLPITDTTTVFFKRLYRRQNPFVGGRDHTTHHLSYLGLTDRQVALIFLVLSALSVVLTVSIAVYIWVWKPMHVLLFGTYLLALFLFLFIVAVRTKPDRN